MKLHTLPQAQLNKLVVDKLLKDNPALKLGDWMQGPLGLAIDGVLQRDMSFIDEKYVLEARTISVPYDEHGNLPSLEMSAHGYLHPYFIGCLCGPSQYPGSSSTELLAKAIDAELGELVTVINSTTFMPELQPVTEAMKKSLRKLMIRFAISGTWKRWEQASFE